MNYDIKIQGNEADNGLEFDRLSQIARDTKEIATKALMLRVRGFSDIKPDAKLKSALDIRLAKLVGDANNGTEMLLDCDSFNDSLKNLQLNLFKATEDILQLTPMALVIQSFRSALIDGEDLDNLDKPLIKSLLKFKNNIVSDEEIFYLSNRNTIPEIKFKKKDFDKIAKIEDAIPEPRKVIVKGKLDEMKISKGKLGLMTTDGMINVFANNRGIVDGIISFLGKDVTITGIAHFKPNGIVSFVEIEHYNEPGVNDEFFSKKPRAMNTEQQILFQIKQGKKKNPLSEIAGSWPGDESDEEFEELLKSL